MRKKHFSLLKILLIAFFVSSYLYLAFFYFSHPNSSSPSTLSIKKDEVTRSTVRVSRVVDGDTFEIDGGTKVRLIGINTPEMKNTNKAIDCFATEAKLKLESLIGGKEVQLEKDVSETDKYGRLLRYVYLNNVMINDSLVKEGFAKIATFPPDVKNASIFLQSERLARQSNLGLWKACK